MITFGINCGREIARQYKISAMLTDFRHVSRLDGSCLDQNRNNGGMYHKSNRRTSLNIFLMVEQSPFRFFSKDISYHMMRLGRVPEVLKPTGAFLKRWRGVWGSWFPAQYDGRVSVCSENHTFLRFSMIHIFHRHRWEPRPRLIHVCFTVCFGCLSAHFVISRVVSALVPMS